MRPCARAMPWVLAAPLLALAVAWLATAAASAAGAPPSDGDWTVTAPVTLEDGGAIMHGDLTIAAGGDLTLRNYTLLFDCRVLKEFGIAVRPGGALRVTDGSRLGATRPGVQFTAYAEQGSTLRILDSLVAWCGIAEWGLEWETTNWRNISFCVETDDAVVERSLFTGGAIGLSFPGPGMGPPVRNCTFRTHHGVITSRTWVEDCTFEGGDLSKGVWVFLSPEGLVVRVLRCAFDEATASGVEVYRGEALVQACTFTRSARGVMAETARMVRVEGCTFDGIVQEAIRGDESTILVTDGRYVNLTTTTAVLLGSRIDWDVLGEALVEGGSVVLSGNLTLAPGARMRLLGARSLTMLSSEASPLHVTLGAGSALELSGTSLEVPATYHPLPCGWPVRFNGTGATLVLRDAVRFDVGGPVVLEELEAHRSRLPLGNWTVHRVHLEGCDLERTAGAGAHRLTVGEPHVGLADVGALIGCTLVGLPGDAPADGPWLYVLGGTLTSVDFLHGLEGMLARGEVWLPEGQGGARLDVLWTVTVEVFWQNGFPASGAAVMVRNEDGYQRSATAGADGVATVAGVRTEVADGSSARRILPLTIEATSHGSTGRETLAGVESPPKVVVVIKDGTPPTLRLDQPGRIGTRVPVVVLSGSVADGESGVALLEARLPRQGPLLVNVSWPSGTFELSVKVNSPFTAVSLRLYDQAGNSAGAEVTIYYSVTPPIIFSIEPPDDVVVNTSHIEVWGETEPNITVEALGRSQLTDRGAFRLLVQLAEGPNVITVNFTDLAGNRNRTSVRAIRDTVAPGLDITRPAGSALLTNARAQAIEGRADAGCRVLVNTVELDVDATGAFSAMVALTRGTQTFEVSAVDAAGNVFTTTVVFTLDDVPPAMTVSFPPEGGLLTNLPSLQAELRVDADALLALNGSPLAVGNGTVRAAITLREGENELRFVATDATGNLVEVVRTVTFHGPPLPLELDADMPPTTASPVYRVSGRTAPGARVTVNGIPMAVDMDGAFRGTFFLQDGVNRLRVVAQDAFGNAANASLTVEVAEPPPDMVDRAPSLLPSLIVASVLVLLAETFLLLRSRAKRENP